MFKKGEHIYVFQNKSGQNFICVCNRNDDIVYYGGYNISQCFIAKKSHGIFNDTFTALSKEYTCSFSLPNEYFTGIEK